MQQKKVCSGVTGEEVKKTLSFYGDVAKTILFCRDLGFKENREGENVKVKDIFLPFCPKLHISYKADIYHRVKYKGKTKLSWTKEHKERRIQYSTIA